MRQGFGVALKRTVDIIGAGVGLLVLAPVFVVLGVLIKLLNPGPVFFRQGRVGRNGHMFRLVKFRSMRIDAETVLTANPDLWQAYMENDFKLPEGQDPRVTPIGHWLRKTSLDELPQLWNVLVGEMSLVGPRPLVQSEIETWYGARAQDLLSVRPGMTGLWQVNGRSDVGYPDRAQLELRYVYCKTFWGDIGILLRTVQAVLSGRGAH
jgi:exopolysaccharide production protein ExoY